MTNAAASTRSKPGAEPPHDEPAPAVSFTEAEELDAYRRMLLIRRFEEKAGQLYGMGLIGGLVRRQLAFPYRKPVLNLLRRLLRVFYW